MRFCLQKPDFSGYLANDTIAAIASAVGGALAVIRISGTQALEIGLRLGASPNHREQPRELLRAVLRDPSQSQFLDDGLAVYFPGPRSFTGEDVLELHLHGGSFSVSAVLEAILAQGARQALPGEFSFRAVRHGKMSLSQAHAVADLIGAASSDAVSLAVEKIQGSQAHTLGPAVEELRTIAALAEVGIDFSDQDVEEVSLPTLKRRVSHVGQLLGSLRDSYIRGRRIQEGIRVAFVGLPNAGKSSVFNALLGEDRSIVSSLPGTTRDIVHERLTLKVGGGAVTLRVEDTAGVRESHDLVESLGVERSRKAASEAELLLWVLDVSRWAEDRPVLEGLWRSLGTPAHKTLVIPNQLDRATSLDIEAFHNWLQALGVSAAPPTSCQTRQGFSECVQAISDRVGMMIARRPGELLLTRLSDVQAVEASLSALQRGLSAPTEDLFAADLREALSALEPLAGKTAPEDLLGRIFSTFCIGK